MDGESEVPDDDEVACVFDEEATESWTEGCSEEHDPDEEGEDPGTAVGICAVCGVCVDGCGYCRET